MHPDPVVATEKFRIKLSFGGNREVGMRAGPVFTLGELDTRRPVVWYRHGLPDANGRPFPTGGLQAVHDPKRFH